MKKNVCGVIRFVEYVSSELEAIRDDACHAEHSQFITFNSRTVTYVLFD